MWSRHFILSNQNRLEEESGGGGGGGGDGGGGGHQHYLITTTTMATILDYAFNRRSHNDVGIHTLSCARQIRSVVAQSVWIWRRTHHRKAHFSSL